MTQHFHYVVFQDEQAFVARCQNIEITSDGASEVEAVANLREALELYLGSSEFVLHSVPTPNT